MAACLYKFRGQERVGRVVPVPRRPRSPAVEAFSTLLAFLGRRAAKHSFTKMCDGVRLAHMTLCSFKSPPFNSRIGLRSVAAASVHAFAASAVSDGVRRGHGCEAL